MVDRNEYVDTLKARLEEYQKSIEGERSQVRSMLENIEQKEEQILYIKRLLEAEGVDLSSEGIDLSPGASVSDTAFEVLKKRGGNRVYLLQGFSRPDFQTGKKYSWKRPLCKSDCTFGSR